VITGGEKARLDRGLFGICLGFLLVTLDATIVNVALETIQDALGGSLATSQWIVSAYTVTFGALMLSAGAFVDRLGARRCFELGLVVFILGSAFCSLAGSMGVLIAARAVQGVGPAFLMPSILALMVDAFPEPGPRRRALTMWAGVSGVGLAAGPVLGGILVTLAGWRAIFLVNLPVALVALAIVRISMRETPRHSHPLDILGQLLGGSALALLTAGFITEGAHDWSSEVAAGLLIAGVAAAVAFIAVERRVAHPMLPLGIFRNRDLRSALGISALFTFALYGGLFCFTVYLRTGRGLGAGAAGLALLPFTVTMASLSFLSGRIADRFGEWSTICVCLAVGATGALGVAIVGDAPVPVLVVMMVPIGLISIASPALTGLSIGSAPPERVGLTAATFNTTRQIGGSLGIAVLGSLIAVGSDSVSLTIPFVLVALAYGAGSLMAARR
jgi:DHA2 family methylenomycin A resistance protein-like MFS transporter